MDRIRYFADVSVRRAAGLGLLGIALVVAALHFDRGLALDALAVLLTLETLTLYQLGRRAHRVPCERREVWVMMDGQHGMGDGRIQRVVSEIMRETFQVYARRLAGPAAAAWVVDLGMRLSA
ncbi:hypothetical protein [Magnetospirillum aberrantis]|uniref:Uncharacterized protein n=1 Tax=Magnetospirillum aberrantis SpK TaxID=908842 RepID=A0A7C9QUJ1_9PROT|nr:hypothetical protein [Magnetospirillum aberrantis]NFV80717.1 hypothetical protein [Magnetospirillum aberrantis SpK]